MSSESDIAGKSSESSECGGAGIVTCSRVSEAMTSGRAKNNANYVRLAQLPCCGIHPQLAAKVYLFLSSESRNPEEHGNSGARAMMLLHEKDQAAFKSWLLPKLETM